MRKLFLLVCLVFIGYYAASLWTFEDAKSFTTAANWVPLALLVVTFLAGLVHLPIALGLALVLIILTGNTPFLSALLGKLPGQSSFWASLFDRLAFPAEPVLLGLIAAWIVVRFFGNPELDYEYNRASAVRALHFPVGLFCVTVVLASVYAVIQRANVFNVSFSDGIRQAVFIWPFPVLRGEGGLGPVRDAIRLLECVAVYIIVTNELRTMRHVRLFLATLLGSALVVAVLGVLQFINGMSFNLIDRNAQFNKEVHATFPDSNSCAVFLLALLPVCMAALFRGRVMAVLGTLCVAVLMGAIVLTETKFALLLVVLLLAALAVLATVRGMRKKAYGQVALVGVLVAVIITGYVLSAVACKRDRNSRAGKVARKVNAAATAFCTGEWTCAALQVRTCNKLGDFATALAMVNPLDLGDNRVRTRILCGVGYGCFGSEYTGFKPGWVKTKRDGASNMILHILAETGVFGALALVVIVVLAVVWAVMAARKSSALLPGLVVAASLLMLVAGCMTENAFLRPQIQVVFWACVGMCMVVASLAAHEAGSRDLYFLKFLTIALIVGGWSFCVIPKLQAQRYDTSLTRIQAEWLAAIIRSDVRAIRKSFETSGDFHFRPIVPGSARYSAKDGAVLTRMTAPVLAFSVGFHLPSVTEKDPLAARFYIDNVLINETIFTNGTPLPRDPLVTGRKELEIDLRSFPELSAYVTSTPCAVILRVQASRTFVPATVPGDAGQKWKSMGLTNEIGVYVTPLSWRAEPAQKPPEPVVAPAPEAPPAPPAPKTEPAAPPAPAPPAATNSVEKAAAPQPPSAPPPGSP